MRIIAAVLAVTALAVAAAPAHAQQANWPEQPMTVGVGFDRCSVILNAPDDAVRQAQVSQWVLGFFSGMVAAGAERDHADYAGADAGLQHFLNTSPDIRVDINNRVIAYCQTNPDAHVLNIADAVLRDLINEAKQ